jgi:hypothetical protein
MRKHALLAAAVLLLASHSPALAQAGTTEPDDRKVLAYATIDRNAEQI